MCAAGLVSPLQAWAQQAKMPAGKPNLVFVLVDQLRYDALSCHGHPVIKTPHIDQLRKESMDFCNAVSVSPVSSATRASLFTGKYTSSTGMVINELRLNPNHHAMGHVLTENGYNTAYYGKWHLYSNCSQHAETNCAYIPPGPPRLGFDGEWKSFNFRHENYNGFYYEDTPDKIYYGEDVYEPEAQFGFAINYLERASTWENQPFALFLSIGIPHDPWVKNNVPEAYYNLFENSQFPLPQTWSDTPDPYMDRNTEPGPWLSHFKKGLPEMMHVYAAMVASLDTQMGRLMNKIKKLGLDENTIIVFTSDHGEMFGEHGRIQKMIFYDAAAKVPFFIKWDGKIQPGTVSDACLNTPDIMPTLLHMMHLPVPQEVEGKDLSFIPLENTGVEPEFAFMQGMGHTYQWKDGFEWRSVRNKQYTYAVYKRDGKELLFDHINDPKQIVNLAEDKSYQSIKLKMKKQMQQKMKELNDSFENCTWYRDHWVDEDRCIQAAAKGAFKKQ